MELFYLANIRLPTEKAHGLQIMQNCEAFAAGGATVTLYAARRINTPELRKVRDVYAHYGVRPVFSIRRVPCLDLFPVLERFSGKLTFGIQVITYLMALAVTLIFRGADVYYSRDVTTLLMLSLFKPRRALVYEAHALSKSRLGTWLQRQCVRRVGLVVAVTGTLAQRMSERGARQTITAHDGFRADRFAGLPDRVAARASLNLPADAFIVGYVGRLHTMSMSKGVDTLIDAIAGSGQAISLCLVGGPDDMAESLRAQWAARNLPPERFLFAGQVDPARVPAYLAALDVCAMPFPWTEHFAYYASPLKLFEYMAAGRAIVASDLPAVAEVVHDGESALLTPPEDVNALAVALTRLYDDPALVERLATAALRIAGEYAWEARAERILQAVREVRA